MDNPRFDLTLDATRRAYTRIEVVQERHDEKVLEFVARSAMLFQASKHEPELFRNAMQEAGIKPRKGMRPEVVAIRVASGNPRLAQPHWANAAAYLSTPPNNDPPPTNYKEALDYMTDRGGMKALSTLWSAHRKGKEEPEEDITAQIDALLTDIPPDFSAARYWQEWQDGFTAGGYALALVKLDHEANAHILYGTDKQLLGFAKRIKKRSVLGEGINSYIERMRSAHDAEGGMRTKTAGDDEEVEVDEAA